MMREVTIFLLMLFYKDMVKSVVISKLKVEETLQSIPAQGKRLLEPLKSFAVAQRLPLNILEDKEVVNDAEVHVQEADLWHCLLGEVEFIYGGEMVEPWFGKNSDGSENKNELKSKEIKGGAKSILRPGDWLYIPAGEPHQHSCKGTARMIIIKIPKTT